MARGSFRQAWLGLEAKDWGPRPVGELVPIFHDTEMETYLVAVMSLFVFAPVILGANIKTSKPVENFYEVI